MTKLRPAITAESPPGAALDLAPCGLLSFADDGRIRWVNATLLEWIGWRREDLVGRHIESILTPGSRIFYQTHFFPLIRMHGHAEEIFLMLRAESGNEVGVLVNAVRRISDGQGAIDCAFLAVRERRKFEAELLRAKRAAEASEAALRRQTNELRLANEQLAEASAAKSNFLAMMSHELRTPLNAIAGYAQLISMGIHGPVTDAQAGALERIARSQQHLLRLINDLLDLARVESGHISYASEHTRLADIAAEVTAMVEPQALDKALNITVDIDDELAVRADGDKVRQILVNLLGNAVKFTPAGGDIELAAVVPAEESGTVLIRVTDNGVGIPNAQLETIFDPFVQVDSSHTRNSEGSGLGLAISRHLARGMHGDLTVVSAEGEGSTFVLTLERSAAPV